MKIDWDGLNFSKFFHYLIGATGNEKPYVKIISRIDVDSSLAVSGVQLKPGFITGLLLGVSQKAEDGQRLEDRC